MKGWASIGVWVVSFGALLALFVYLLARFLGDYVRPAASQVPFAGAW